MTAYRTTEYVYSDDRLSLAQEIAEGLRARGLWVPQEWAGPDLITAVFRAIDARDAALVEALEEATNYVQELDICIDFDDEVKRWRSILAAAKRTK